jgi:hypothetical protein
MNLKLPSESPLLTHFKGSCNCGGTSCAGPQETRANHSGAMSAKGHVTKLNFAMDQFSKLQEIPVRLSQCDKEVPFSSVQ